MIFDLTELDATAQVAVTIVLPQEPFWKCFTCSLYILVLHCGNSCVKNFFPRMSIKKRIEFYCSLEI
jgi:hypothetical protein